MTSPARATSQSANSAQGPVGLAAPAHSVYGHAIRCTSDYELFWSNEFGWVEEGFDRFTDSERANRGNRIFRAD
jgi:hypothetical protein